MIDAARIESSNTPRFLLLVVIFIVTAAALMVIMMSVPSQHAIEKHGSDAWLAAQTCGSHNYSVKMFNPETSRVAFVCLTERGWGVVIESLDGSNVTAFIKEKMKRIEQVVKYLQNRGYVLNE